MKPTPFDIEQKIKAMENRLDAFKFDLECKMASIKAQQQMLKELQEAIDALKKDI